MKQLRGNWRTLAPGTWSYPALLWWVDDCGFICTKSGQLMDGGPWDLGSPPQCCQVYPTPTACCSDRTECGSKHLLKNGISIVFLAQLEREREGLLGMMVGCPAPQMIAANPLIFSLRLQPMPLVHVQRGAASDRFCRDCSKQGYDCGIEHAGSRIRGEHSSKWASTQSKFSVDGVLFILMFSCVLVIPIGLRSERER